MPTSLGTYLRELREMKSLSTYAVARTAACSQSYVSRLETGSRNPGLYQLWRIVEALGGDLSRALLLVCTDAGIPEAIAERAVRDLSGHRD